jgi:DNA-binding SARP family transcriptional activator
MLRVRVALLGEVAVWIGRSEASIPRTFTAILGFLLVQPRFSASRDRLAGALWPAATDAAARSALSTALWRARAAAIECDSLIAASGDRFTLTPAALRAIDLVFFERALDRLFALREATLASWRRRLGRALVATEGALFAEMDDEWAVLARERWRWRRLDALVLLADLALANRAWADAASLGRAVCAAEPLREDAQRLLIEALARSGNRALALRQYDHCAAVLEAELGIAPMAATRELADRLRAPDPPGTARPPVREGLVTARKALTSALHEVDLAIASI